MNGQPFSASEEKPPPPLPPPPLPFVIHVTTVEHGSHFDLFTRCASMDGRCLNLSWQTYFSAVVQGFFHAFSLDSFHESFVHETGRPLHLIVHGSSSVYAMGQEKMPLAG